MHKAHWIIMRIKWSTVRQHTRDFNQTDSSPSAYCTYEGV